MSFAHPLALLLLLLLIPVGLLYWLRLRVPRSVVGTGLFWQKALAEEPRRARWQRWRTPASLVIQVSTVILLALAAAGPEIPPAVRTVLILDNSATMRASDVSPTRFDAAKEAARRMIESLRWCDEMAIVTASPEPRELQPMTSDRALLLAAVDAAQPQAAPPAIDAADQLASEIQIAYQLPARVVWIADACSSEARGALPSDVDMVRVGTAAGNRAITCFTARRSKVDPAQCEVFVEVQNRGNESAQGSLALSVDDKPGESAKFAIEKGGRWQHLFALTLPAAARLTARIAPADAYPFDDTAALELPAAPQSHRVKLEPGDETSLSAILGASPRISLVSGDDAAKAIDVIVGKTPDKLPPGPALIFSPAACDLWQLGDPVADPLLTHVDETSPVTGGVRLADVYLSEARQLKLADSVRGLARPILWAGTTPLGYAIDRPEGRVVVVCGNLATSNLTLRADFPKLVAQALDWLDHQEPWKDAVNASATASGLSDPVDLRVPENIGSNASTLNYPRPSLPLALPLAAAAAALLILEWCLYQRRWTS